ncbi:RNA polymerase sigma factor [Planctomycetota bacterium]
MLEDKLLVWKLKRGSRDALQRIYEKYRDDLLRVGAGLLIEKSAAEDVVHDVFASFVESCESFVLTGSLRGYLVTCVANRARNLNRSQSRRATAGPDELEERMSNLKRPVEWIIDDEKFRQVSEAMSKLPYEQREVVALRIQGAMKFKDIARHQETSIKTTLSRYRYGMDKLHALLQEGS